MGQASYILYIFSNTSATRIIAIAMLCLRLIFSRNNSIPAALTTAIVATQKLGKAMTAGTLLSESSRKRAEK